MIIQYVTNILGYLSWGVTYFSRQFLDFQVLFNFNFIFLPFFQLILLYYSIFFLFFFCVSLYLPIYFSISPTLYLLSLCIFFCLCIFLFHFILFCFSLSLTIFLCLQTCRILGYFNQYSGKFFSIRSFFLDLQIFNVYYLKFSRYFNLGGH